MFETINFTMVAESRQRDEHAFRDIIARIIANGAGGASFEAAEINGGAAYLQGTMVGDPRLVAEAGLAEYLADVLARKEGIHLNITVHLTSPYSTLHAKQTAAAA